VTEQEANAAQFWVLRYLLEPILSYLATHREDPVTRLEASVTELPNPPDWEAMMASAEESARADSRNW